MTILTQSLDKIVAVPTNVQTVPVLAPKYATTSIPVKYIIRYFRPLTTTYENRSVGVFGQPTYRTISNQLFGSQVVPTL